MKNYKKIFMTGLSVAGAVIGAGFATGKEIMLFFPEKGFWGIISLTLSLFGLVMASLLYCFKEKNKLDRIFEYLFLLFVAGSFSVMLSCGGEALNEVCGLPFTLGCIITYLISIFITRFDLKGIFVFNLIISPLMILTVLAVCVKALSLEVFFNASKASAITPDLLSVSYCGYNLLSLIPFLSALKAKEKNKKIIISGTFLGIALVLICGIFIKLTTDKFYELTIFLQLPMLKIAGVIGKSYSVLYSALIYFAILTTAVSGLFSLKEKGNIYLLTPPLLILSFFGFDSLIKSIYGIFGYTGAVFIIYIILSALKTPKSESAFRK